MGENNNNNTWINSQAGLDGLDLETRAEVMPIDSF